MFSVLLELLLRPFTYTHTIIKDIGCGSFGTILLTQSKRDKNYHVAKFIKIKRIKDYVGYHPESMIPLEIYIQAQLDHPSIARIVQCYKLSQHWVFTMPYCYDYIDLKSFIKIHIRLDEAVARTIFIQVYNAVSYCFTKGVDHRDIKHQNILINRTSLHIKLIDFGLASICGPGTVYTKVQGTELFLAPEAIIQKRYTPLENTTWALGCLLYCMVCHINCYLYRHQHGNICYLLFTSFKFNPQNLRNTVKKIAKISITQIVIIELFCQNKRILLFF